MEISVTAASFAEAKQIAARASDMMQDSGYSFISATTRKADSGWQIVSMRFELKEQPQ